MCRLNPSLGQVCCWLRFFFIPSTQALASFHQDIEVSRVSSSIQAGFCSRPELGCDIAGVESLGLPPNTLPTDFETGKDIYVTAFTHFVFSGQHATDNPGFQSAAGALAGNEVVFYQALGVMEFWNPATGAWDIAPDNVQIRLAGGRLLDPVIDQSCGRLICPPKTEGSTNYSGKGVSGAESLIVGSAAANGSLHTHLNWFLETNPGTANGGPAGAYLVEMSLFSDKRPTRSDSFYILFNNQLDVDVDVKNGEGMSDFQRAVSMRVLGPSLAEVPIPAAFFLFLGALGLMSGGRLLRRS